MVGKEKLHGRWFLSREAVGLAGGGSAALQGDRAWGGRCRLPKGSEPGGGDSESRQSEELSVLRDYFGLRRLLEVTRSKLGRQRAMGNPNGEGEVLLRAAFGSSLAV